MKKNISLLTGLAVLTTAFGLTGNAIAQVNPIEICNFAWTDAISSFDEKTAPSGCITVNPLSFSFQKTVDEKAYKDLDGSKSLSTGDILFFDINVTGVTGDGNFTIYDEWDPTLFEYDPVNIAPVSLSAPSGATLGIVTASGTPTNQLAIPVTGMQAGDVVQVPLVYIGTDDGNDESDSICNTLSTIVDESIGDKYSVDNPTPGGADVLEACIDDTVIRSYSIEKYSKDAFDKDGNSLGEATATTLNPGSYVHYVINVTGDPVTLQTYDVFPDEAFEPVQGTNVTGITPTTYVSFDDTATNPAGFDVIDYGVYDFSTGAIDVIVEVN